MVHCMDNWHCEVIFSIKLTLFLNYWDSVFGSEINNELSTVGSTSFFILFYFPINYNIWEGHQILGFFFQRFEWPYR